MTVVQTNNREASTALSAQSGAIGLAHRLQRELQTSQVDDEGFEVDVVVDHVVDLALLGRLLGRAVRVCEELDEVEIRSVLEWFEASHTFARGRCNGGAGDEHPLGDRLQSEIEIDLCTGLDRDEVQTDPTRRLDLSLDGFHPAWATAQRADFEHKTTVSDLTVAAIGFA